MSVWTPSFAFELKFKPKLRRVEFLGRQVSPRDVEMGDSYVEAVWNWAAPRSTNDEERFLGFANYHPGFIAGYAQLAFPLYCLTRKKPFIWEQEQQAAFDDLKKALTSPPVLSLLTPDDFILDTDASAEAKGAELSQIQDGQESPLPTKVSVYTAEQRRYYTIRKELLAVVRFARTGTTCWARSSLCEWTTIV